MKEVINTDIVTKRPSNKEVNRAGEIIRNSNDDEEIKKAISVLDNWRSLHSIPLNSVRSFINRILKKVFKGKNTNAILGQRLKRMPSIITKIKRFENMSVSRMQDIGGIRIILDSIKDVYTVHDAIIHANTNHEYIIPPKDYIKEPKKDGYRSLHQVLIYHNDKNLDCDGMRIEVQIRTKLEHSWATAVETLGSINNASYKTGEGSLEEKKFFKLASTLFAIKEEQNLPEEFINTSKEDLVLELQKLDNKLNILNSLSSISDLKLTSFTGKGFKYFVLELTIMKENKGDLKLTPFQSEDDARSFYKLKEDETRSFSNKSVLLITEENIKNIKKAYPNYFLDTKLFVKELRKIMNS
ncbi:MAG: RelA/SpoT domain-containing protein [Succinivibrionaceae bacterium]|nr:RelA/SpoT domain-containing protein [Succinivibrionaceae bacterium]